MAEELAELVLAFQRAEAQRCDEDCSELFQAIRAKCRNVIMRIRNGSQNPEIADYIDEKLYDCVRTFDPDKGQYFRAMYRQALKNKVIDLHRRNKPKGNVGEIINRKKKDTDEVAKRIWNQEDLDLYRKRKRAILDELALDPPHKMSTLLLDQRQRVADIHGGSQYSTDESGVSCGAWVEYLELWNSADNDRLLAKNEPWIATLWAAFSRRADVENATSQLDMVAAFAASGLNIASATWRKRVSRYQNDVREKVDVKQWNYFHFNH